MATMMETVRETGKCLWAMVRARCPRCQKGRVFRGHLAMNDPCPVCDLVFQREEGYFLGAMYVSYVLATALLVPFYFIAAALLPDWDGSVIALVALLPYLPCAPAVFRYSRVLWIHLDRAMDPSAVSAGPYEKVRLRRLAEQNATRPGAGTLTGAATAPPDVRSNGQAPR